MRKDRKLYLWDWSLCKNSDSRFENMVAANLLKYCHYHEDTQGDEMELCFLRDNRKREVDFVVLRDGRPEFVVECKSHSKSVSKSLAYFFENNVEFGQNGVLRQPPALICIIVYVKG